MMKRLLTTVPDAMKHIMLIVFTQVISLIINILMIFIIADYFGKVIEQEAGIFSLGGVILAALLLRIILQKAQTVAVFKSSENVKAYFRDRLFKKVYGFGLGYVNHVTPAELVQVGVEGIEQLDSFYGRFIPQLIYSILSPLILFAFLVNVNAIVATVLLLFVPLIPLAIVLVQKLAKKVMGAYWGSFINLSDKFLDNIQGLSTLKLYGADVFRGEKMDAEAEGFRRATMRLLRMQLANIIAMDLVAYGGAGFGTAIAIYQLQLGALNLSGAILFILLVAEFFLPLRLLGSFFHIAMNGMASAERMFRIFDIENKEDIDRIKACENSLISLKNLCFEYNAGELALENINLEIPEKGMISFVGSSGCGKSTLAAVINGSYSITGGSIGYGEPFGDRSKERITQNIAFVDASPWLFTGTVEMNLKMANPEASDEELWKVLKDVRLDGFLKSLDGLKTEIKEGGSNFSGGQRQRLAIARVLLRKAAIYIFDEATSNIDAESEEIILEIIKEIKERAAVILITHHITLTLESDKIIFLEKGRILEEGRADELIEKDLFFAKLYHEQQKLENFNGEKDSLQNNNNGDKFIGKSKYSLKFEGSVASNG